MKTYSQLPQNSSVIEPHEPRASRQASATDILQKYAPTPIQRQSIDEDELLQGKFDTAPHIEQELVQREEKPNNTGLPDNLKTGIENLSGYSMDDVKVYYNSDKPAQLQALAYAQGTDIHVAPGQEKHLPHEVWHVVQQKQGRVQPTMQKQGVNVNDNEGLEKEADIMGEKGFHDYENISLISANDKKSNIVQQCGSDDESEEERLPIDWTTWDSSAILDIEIKNYASIAKYIVDYLWITFEIKANIGGSLDAKVFGGARLPQDIDIIIVNAPNSLGITRTLDFVKEKLKNLRNKEICKDLELVGIAGNTIYYKGIDTEPKTVTIDLSLDSKFEIIGVKETDEFSGYYSPEYLIASYLNRIAGDEASTARESEEKGDRDQAKCILKWLIENGKGGSEIKTLVLAKIIEVNTRKIRIGSLFDEIIDEL